MRQEEGNDIIDLSMKIRQGEALQPSKGNNAVVLSHDDLSTGMLKWADIVLCATNKTRVELNNKMRELRGFGPELQDGDRLICKRNYDSVCSTVEKEPLVNGVIGTANNVRKKTIYLPYWSNVPKVECYLIDLILDSGDYYKNILIDRVMLETGKYSLDSKLAYSLRRKKGKNQPPIKLPLEFLYGYGITTHAAQGSEWEKVLVIEEPFPFKKEEHSRWVYTALTRASDRLVVIKK